MLTRIVAAAYGLWLLFILYVFYVTRGVDDQALQVAVLVGVIPVGLQLLLLGVDPRGLAGPMKFSLALLLSILVSYLADLPVVADWMPVIYTFNAIYLFAVAMIIAGSPDARLMPMAAASYAAVTALLLVYVNIYGHYIWGRLDEGNLQPNFWGLIGLSVAVAGFGFRNALATAVCIAIGCWTMYAASARGSELGLAMAVFALILRALPRLRGNRLYFALAGTAALALAVMVSWQGLMALVPELADKVLVLDDPNRGLNTGFTGRSGLWTEALQIWMTSPLFGVGFRMHELFLNAPAHNSYLAVLADTGVVGLVIYATFLACSLGAAWRLAEPRAAPLAVATIVGYAVLGFFERRAINTGNPFGFLIIMVCYYALVLQARHRAVAVRQPDRALSALPAAGSP